MSETNTLELSLTSHPSPAFSYEVRDDRLIVTAINDAFDTAIGVDEGNTVTAVFNQFDTVTSSGAQPPEMLLRAGEAGEFFVSVDGSRYAAHVLAPDTSSGTVVFTERVGDSPFGAEVDAAQVASVLSHDLRNPLDVAGAHLEAARETGDPEHFEAVAAAHSRMEQIIQDVLTLARGEAALDIEAGVSVSETANDAWSSVETETWTLHLENPLPTVRADPARLQRLFENLFRNCIEHGPDGGTVRLGPLGDGTAGAFVADDGPGIPERERAAVFQPGYTIDDRGSGLGLAIVDRIADAHGWTVSLTDSTSDGLRTELRFDMGE